MPMLRRAPNRGIRRDQREAGPALSQPELPNRIWEPTGRCGCGACRFGAQRGGCPMSDSPTAIRLWRSRERLPEEPKTFLERLEVRMKGKGSKKPGKGGKRY